MNNTQVANRGRSGKMRRTLLALALVYVAEAGATNYISRTGSAYWSNAGAWAGTMPQPGGEVAANLIFTNSTGFSFTNDLASSLGRFTLNSLTFSNAGNVTIWGASTNWLVLTNSGGQSAQLMQMSSGSNAISHNLLLASDLYVQGSGSGTMTLNNTITGSVGLIKNGNFTLILNGANTYRGNTTNSAGLLALNFNNALGGGMLVMNGGALASSSGNACGFTNTMRLLANSTFGQSSGGTGQIVVNGVTDLGGAMRTLTVSNSFLALAGAVTNGGIVKQGPGTLILSNVNNTYNLGTTNYAGTLALGTNNVFGSGALVLAGGVLASDSASARSFNNPMSIINNAAFGSLMGTGNLTNSGVVNLSGNWRYLTVSNTTVMSGSVINGGLVKQGAGTLVLLGSNTYSTGTVLSGGTLEVGGYANLPGGALTINGGTLRVTGTQITNLAPYTVNWYAFNGGLDVNNSSNTLTVGNAILGTGGITKLGAGTLALSGSNIFSGGLTISSGTVALGADHVLGSGTVFLNGGTLASDGGAARSFSNGLSLVSTTPQFGSTSGTGNLTNSGTVNLNGGGHFLTVNNTTVLTGVISNGSLSKLGSGTLVLSGANTYGGGTTNVAGTLALGADNVLGSGRLVLSGGTLASADAQTRAMNNAVAITTNVQFGLSNVFSGNLTLNGAVDLGTGPRTLTVFNTTTLGGVLTNTAGFVKAGPGSLVLSASNTLRGVVTVNAGALYVNNALASTSVIVAANAKLGGTGAILNSVTINSGGSLEAGQNGSGTLYLGNLTFSGAATNSYGDLSHYTSWPGIYVNTNVTVSGANSILMSIGNVSAGGVYHLMYYGGSMQGTGLSAFRLGTLPNGLTGNLLINGGHYLDLQVNGTDGTVVWVGGNGSAWDTTTTGNWKLSSDGSATLFNNLTNNAVQFDDTASNSTINIAAGHVTPASVVFYNSTVNYTLQGSYGIAGAAALSKNGVGTLTINTTNSYSGGTTLNAGTLALGADNVLGSGPLVLGGGTLASDSNTARILSNDVSITVDTQFGSAGGNGGLLLSGAVDLGAAPRTLILSNTTTLSGVLTNGSGFTKSGAGTLVIGGATVGNGSITNAAGILALGADNALGGGMLLLTGGALASDSSAARSFSNALAIAAPTQFGTTDGSGNLTNSGSVNLSSGIRMLVISNTTVFTGPVSNGGISKLGGGALVLRGVNTSFYPTTNAAGTLALGVDNALGSGQLILAGGILASDSSAARSLTNRVFISTNTVFGSTAGTGDLTLSGPFDVGSVQRTLTLSNNVIVSGVVSNSGGFLKAGPGTLVLAGTNLMTGFVGVNAGQVVVASPLALQNATVTNMTGALLFSNVSRATLGNLGGAGNLALTNAAGGAVALTVGGNHSNQTYQGVLLDGGAGGSLIKTGNGALTLAGVNTYTGGTTLNGGTLAIGSYSNLPAGALNFSGGTLRITGTQVTNLAPYAVNWSSFNGGLDVNNAGNTLLVSNVIGGTGSLTVFGSGVLVLTGANTYSGGTALGGKLALGADNVLGSGTLLLGSGTLASDSSAARSFSNNLSLTSVTPQFGTATGTGNLTNSGTVNLNGYGHFLTVNNTTVFTGPITNGGFSKNGAGTLVLSGASTYNGGTTNAAGTLALGADNVLGSGRLVLSGGALASADGTARFLSNAVSISANSQFGLSNGLSGNLTLSGMIDQGTSARILTVYNTTTLAGPLTNTAGFVKAGAGTLVLAGSNNYGGATLVSAGVLQVGQGGTRGSLGTGVVTNNGTLTFNRSDALNLANTLAGSGAFIQAGTGTLNLLATNQANTFTGSMSVNAGVLAVGEDSQLGATTSPLLLDGGTLRLSAKVGSLSLNNAGSGFTNAATVTIKGGTNGVGVAASAQALSHPTSVRIVNAGSNYVSAPTVSFYGSQAANGLQVQAGGYATITNGRLASIVITNGGFGYISAAMITLSGGGGSNASASVNGYTVDALQMLSPGIGYTTAPAVTLSGGGSNFSITANVTAANLAAGRGVTLNAGGGTFDVDAGYVPYISGVIGGVGALTKIGSGTLQLNGSNTYAGATTIKGGTLLLAGANGALAGTSGVLLRGGTLALFNAAAANNSSRLGAGLALTSYGGGLTVSNDGSSTAFSATLGALNLNAGNLDLQAAPGVGGQTASLTLGTFQRAAGSTLRIIANQLGESTNTIAFAMAPALAGGILPGAVVLHDGQIDLVTHDGVDGHALTAFAGYETDAETAWTGNAVIARPTFSQTLTDNRMVHSLVLDNGINLNSPATNRVLTLGNGGVGMIVQTGGASQIIPGADVQNVLAFGANEAVFDVEGRLTLATRNAVNAISGSGGLTKTGVGILQLGSASNANFRQTTTGSLCLNQGLLDVYATHDAALNSFSNIVFNGGSLSLHTASNRWFANALIVNADAALTNYSLDGAGTTLAFSNLTIGAQTLTLAAGGQASGGSVISFDAVTLTGNSTFYISTNGACGNTLALGTIDNGGLGYTFTKAGPGALTLNGAGAHQGATAVNDGVLILAGNNCLDTNSSVTVASGGTLVLNGNSQTIDGLSGDGVISNATGSLTVGNADGSSSFNGTISGGGSLTKVGAGTLTLGAQSDYSGGTTIAGGTVELATPNALPTNGNVTVNGGALALAGQTQTVAALHNDGGTFSTGAGGVLQGTGATIEWGGNSVNTINTNGFVIDGHVVITSSGANLVEGGGTLLVAANGAGLFLTNSTLVLNSDPATPGRLVLSNDVVAAQQAAMVSGGSEVLPGQIDLGGATRQFTVVTNGVLFVGASLANGNLAKAGAGQLNLTGDNSSFAGQTLVSAGALSANGNLGGLITVYNGGMLGGTGALGAVVISGGIYSPGNSPGTQSVASLSFTGGLFSVEFVGGAQDLVVVTNGANGLALSAAASRTFLNIALTNFDATLYEACTIVDNQSSQAGDSYGHFWWHSAGGDVEMNNFFDFVVNDRGTGSNLLMRISYAGGDGNDITLTAIPEPQSVLILLVAACGLALGRRWKIRWQYARHSPSGRWR